MARINAIEAQAAPIQQRAAPVYVQPLPNFSPCLTPHYRSCSIKAEAGAGVAGEGAEAEAATQTAKTDSRQ